MIKGISGAIGFLSRIPVGTSVKPSESVGDFPIVGYMSGGLYILMFWVFGRSLPVVIISIFIVYLLFNAFHFDGLLDMSDAFMSQKRRERKFEIMKMGNVGPMGVLVGVLYMITTVFMLENIPFIAILAATVSGRYAMVLTAYFSKPAKANGLGSSIFPLKLKTVLHASIYLVPFVFFPRYLLIVFFSIIAAFIMKFISDKMMGGLTGDVLGAIEEIAEITGMVSGFYLF